MTVSLKLDSVERRIQEKQEEVAGTPRDQQGAVHDELRALQAAREKLREKWQHMDGKLQEGAILSAEEERR